MMASGGRPSTFGRYTVVALKFIVSFGILVAFATVVDIPMVL
jgi:hypothetical protein